MSNPLVKMLIWIVLGLGIGFIVSLLFFSPAPQTIPSVNLTQNLSNNSAPTAAFSQTMVIAPNCDVCNSIDPVFSGLATYSSSTGITLEPVVKFDPTSSEGEALISRYSIAKLPVIILRPKGNISQTAFSDLIAAGFSKENDGAVVLREIKVPYYEISSSKPVGFVSAIAIRPHSCLDCMDPQDYFTSLEQDGINFYFSNKTVLDENDSIARSLIQEYNITKLPVLMLSSGASYYPSFEFLTQIGTVEGEWFILRNVTPPYVDLSNNHSIVGNVQEILIVNSSCTTCFNAQELADYISTSANLHIYNKSTYEANSSMHELI
jgi:hypothetical protein